MSTTASQPTWYTYGNQMPRRGCSRPGLGTTRGKLGMQDQSSVSHAHGAEEWSPVPGHEGYYEVSDLGRVRSLRFKNRRVDKARPEARILAPYDGGDGYLRVYVAGRRLAVHRMVLEAFVGPCPPGMEGAHLNGVRADARLVNLAWVTPVENQSHRWLHGTMLAGDASPSRLHPERLARGADHGRSTHPERTARGARVGGAKLTEDDVRAIRQAFDAGESATRIAARFGVGPDNVSLIGKRVTWRHLP